MRQTTQLSAGSLDRWGWFVTFEGGEGTGKSTQCRRLAARLGALGREAVLTREPGGSHRAEAIRRVLLAGRIQPFGEFAEAALFSAARADHVRATIMPALEQGAIVLCDRFVDSTRVYQGAVGRVPDATIAALERSAVGALRPDLTLVLDLSAEIGLERARIRRRGQSDDIDRFEATGLGYHQRIRAAFLTIAQAEPDRCVVLPATGSPDEVEAAVWAVVDERLRVQG